MTDVPKFILIPYMGFFAGPILMGLSMAYQLQLYSNAMKILTTTPNKEYVPCVPKPRWDGRKKLVW